MSAPLAKDRIGFTCSTFDLLHAGHIQMLRDAKSVCDYLIVGLQNDPTEDRPEKNKPVQSIKSQLFRSVLLSFTFSKTEVSLGGPK